MLRILILLIAMGTTACATSPNAYEARIDELERELRQARRERDAAREDYEYDIVRALRRDDLERRFPNTPTKSFNEKLVEALDGLDNGDYNE